MIRKLSLRFIPLMILIALWAALSVSGCTSDQQVQWTERAIALAKQIQAEAQGVLSEPELQAAERLTIEAQQDERERAFAPAIRKAGMTSETLLSKLLETARARLTTTASNAALARAETALEAARDVLADEQAQDSQRYAQSLTPLQRAKHEILEAVVRGFSYCIMDFEYGIDYVWGSGTGPRGRLDGTLYDDPEKGSVLKIDYGQIRPNDAYGFVWFVLNGFDAASFQYVSLDVKGDPGTTRRFSMELKTPESERSPYPTADLRVDEGWYQRRYLKLSEFYPDLSRLDELTELVFVVSDRKATSADGTLYIDNVCFSGEEVTLAHLNRLDADASARLAEEVTLEEIEHRGVRYFWEQVNVDTGLIKDRSTEDSPASIAAVGFGLTALTIGVERGWLDRDAVYDRVLTTLHTFHEEIAQEHGFFYHFLDMQSGERVWESEASSIDTALLLAGALFAGQYFEGTEVEQLARQLYERVDWVWMLDGESTLAMGWEPKSGFLSARWADYAEQMILYLMAIGSPTHPISPESWGAWQRPVARRYGLEYIHNVFESAFVYTYSHAYVDFRDKHDRYADYWLNSQAALRANREFVLQHMDEYATYGPNIWGLSAGDGPEGYRNYGAAPGNHDGTITPYAMIAALPLLPELSQRGIETLTERFADKIWGRYGFTSAFNVDRDFYSREFIGIDLGISVLMAENHHNAAFVWGTFMQLEPIQRAMAAVGFVDERIDAPLTDDYRQTLENQR